GSSRAFAMLPLRTRWLLLAVGLVVGWGGGTKPANGQAKWGVLAYLSGDGSLEWSAMEYLRRLASAPPMADVVIGVQIDRGPGFSSEVGDFVDARRIVFESTPGRREWRWSNWRAEVNMGDPEVLVEFLNWALTQLPAKQYVLLVVGHGSGVRPLAKDPIKQRDYGVAYDATSNGDSLTTRELATACQAFVDITGGQKISLLAIDGCFSASVEGACEVATSVEFLSGSPDLLYEPGVPWDKALASLCEFPAMSAEKLAGELVDGLQTSSTNGENVDGSYVVVRLSECAQLQEALSALSIALRNKVRETTPLVVAARARAMRAGLSKEMLDLGGFLEGLNQEAQREGQTMIAELATQAQAALNATLLRSYAAEGTRTLSIFFPPNLSEFPEDYLSASRFAHDSGWGAFVKAHLDHLQVLVSRGLGT
ncbi:MAG: clostripain-related cysteine peptidase, partial [Candidatus Zipacnadales bacterium]